MAGAMGSKRRGKSGPPFVRLFRFIKRSEAWHELSVYGRCALIELIDRYNGINNGMIGLGVRELADALKCSHGCAGNALRELDDSGLAHPVTGGLWRGKRATEWRLTFHRCDKTGELPFKAWPPRQVSTSESTKVHEGKHKTLKCPPAIAHIQKNPINDPAKRPPGDTHIDIYQVGTGLEAGAQVRCESSKTAIIDLGKRRRGKSAGRA
jgi:hypothetical protein